MKFGGPMKFQKIIVPIIIALILGGCSGSDSNNSAGNSQTPSSQTSQTESAAAAESETEASSEAPPVSSPIQLTAVSFEWIGLDQDILSPNEIKADSKPDGHFHITVPFGQPAGLRSIWIRYAEFGKSLKWGWIYNKNLPLNGYLIAVLDNSGKAVLPQADNGYGVEGVTDFDLYLSELDSENGRDIFKFGKGQKFDLEINYVTQENVEKQVISSVTIE